MFFWLLVVFLLSLGSLCFVSAGLFPCPLGYFGVLAEGSFFSFSLLVLFVSALVFFFSFFYMSGESHFEVFSVLLGCFVLSMLFLLTSKSLFLLLFAWDGLGLTSVLLVCYFSSLTSVVSGLVTFMSARVGDSFLMACLCLFLFFGSFGFPDKLLVSSCFVFVCFAALTKSAMVPFSGWLPRAMSAPTPVSSLVHSSTLVVGGFVLLLFWKDELFSFWVFFLGCSTFIVASLASFLEKDLKKIVALSTLMHMGVLFLLLGLGFVSLSVFHMFMHALFKCLLFLLVGGGLFSSKGSQIETGFSSSVGLSSVAVLFLTFSLFSLNGLVFVGGFFSKELFVSFSFSAFLGCFLVLGFSSSLFYSTKLFLGLLSLSSFYYYQTSFGFLVSSLGLVLGGFVSTVATPAEISFLFSGQLWWLVLFLLSAWSLFVFNHYFLSASIWFWLFGFDWFLFLLGFWQSCSLEASLISSLSSLAEVPLYGVLTFGVLGGFMSFAVFLLFFLF